MPIPYISDLLEIGKSLLDFATSLDAKRAAKEQAIAGLCESISATLKAAAATLEQGDYPHGSCAEIEEFAKSFETVGTKSLPKAKRKQLADELFKAHRIEQLHGELSAYPPKKREAALGELRSAAGRFAATAALLRASVGT